MTREEFRKAAMNSGYGCAYTADAYLKKTNKEQYTEDDFVELFRYHERYMEFNSDIGMRDYKGVRCTKRLTNMSKDR